MSKRRPPKSQIHKRGLDNLSRFLYPFFSNFVEKTLFLCNSDSNHLVSSFIGPLENLAAKSEAKLKNLFLDIKIKIQLGSVLVKLTQRHKRRGQVKLNGCDNKRYDSTQLLHIQKNQTNGLMEHLERYGKVLLVFGFNFAKNDLNIIQSFYYPFFQPKSYWTYVHQES